jgi:hypothetical protein
VWELCGSRLRERAAEPLRTRKDNYKYLRAERRAVKKIICPQCGAVNLEKFVTYPHCAGCSLLLSSEGEGPGEALSLWQKPLRVGLWASLLGAALLGIVAVATREIGEQEAEQLLIFGAAPRRASTTQSVTCRLNFDALEAPAPQHLRELRLVMARSFGQDWKLLEVRPPPDNVQSDGGRTILLYNSWPIDETCVLQLRPRGGGARRIRLIASASGYDAVQWRATVVVSAQSRAQVGRVNAPQNEKSPGTPR